MTIRSIALAAALFAATAAQATTWAFSFSGAAPGSFVPPLSGTFTTVGDGTTPTLITSLALDPGLPDAVLVTPGGYPAGKANDNLFTASAPFFTNGGLTFGLFDGALYFNIFSDGGLTYLCAGACGPADTEQLNFNVSPAPPPPPAVPEPASWAMVIAGFGLVGAVARRRRGAAVAA